MLENWLLGRELLRGVVMGIAIAAPVGPIGILCIRRTLTQGWATGLLSGLGAATADGLYGCIAGLGLVAVSNWLVAQQTPLQLVGGAFLIYLGAKSWRSQPARIPESGRLSPDHPSETNPFDTHPQPDTAIPQTRWLKAYASTLLLTLTNPATILSFIAIFAGLGITTVAAERGLALALIAGIFVGSALWWLFLSAVTHGLRGYLSHRWMQRINYGSGVVMVGFGLVAILSAIA